MNNRYLDKAKKVIKDPKMLAIVSAKRAKQLAMGAKPLSYCNSDNVIDVALLEIAEGKITGGFGDPEAVAAAIAETAAAAAASAAASAESRRY